MTDATYDPKTPAWGRFRISKHIQTNPDGNAPGLHRVVFEVPEDYPQVDYNEICAWSRARSRNQDLEPGSFTAHGTRVAYWPGSILNVQPVLGDSETDALLELVDGHPEDEVEIGGEKMSLRTAVQTRFDNAGPAKPGVIKALVALAPDSPLLAKLQAASRPERAAFGTTLDVVAEVHRESGVKLPVAPVLAACKRKIVPRRYTIASHSLRERDIELVVVESSTQMANGRLDRGICSAMLADCKVGDYFDAQVSVKPDYPPLENDTNTIFLFGRGSGYSGLPHFAWDAIERGVEATIVLATGGTTIRELANLEELEALSQAGVLVVAGLREPESAEAYKQSHPNTKIHFVGKPVGETMAVPGVVEAFMAAMKGGEARICGGPGPTGALTDWLVEQGHITLYPEAQALYDKFQPTGAHKGDKAKALRRHCMRAMELGDDYRGKVFVDVF